jgi:hypothetical protein
MKLSRTIMVWKAKHLIIALLVAIVLRFVFVLLYTDLKKDYYWEYGELSKNVITGRGYSLFYFQKDSLLQRFSIEETPFPSAFMPPGYVAVLIPFITIDNVVLRNILLISFQSLCSLLLIFIIYSFTKMYFTDVSANIAAYAAAIFPDFIYSIVSFTPTILYQCGIVSLMILLYRNDFSSRKIFWGITAISGFVLYLRFEFFLYYIFFILFLMLEKMQKQALLFLVMLLLILSPWIIRNYLIFDEIVPFTTSTGLNLFRGNNAGEIGDWGDEKTNSELKLIPCNRKFEIAYNNVFFQKAKQYIGDHPFQTILNAIKKTSSLWFVNVEDITTNKLPMTAYSFLVLLAFSVGCYASYNWKQHCFTYLFFISTTLVSAMFFVLPRYQTTLRALIIPFASFGIERCWKFFQYYK